MNEKYLQIAYICTELFSELYVTDEYFAAALIHGGSDNFSSVLSIDRTNWEFLFSKKKLE